MCILKACHLQHYMYQSETASREARDGVTGQGLERNNQAGKMAHYRKIGYIDFSETKKGREIMFIIHTRSPKLNLTTA